MVNKCLRFNLAVGAKKNLMHFHPTKFRGYSQLKIFSILSFFLFLCSCDQQPSRHASMPIQKHVCDLFETNDEMLTYWLGIPASTGYPDVKVRLPREYIDFRRGNTKAGQSLDGAIGFGIRPYDFAPSLSYLGVKTYPETFNNPDKLSERTVSGSLLISYPKDISMTLVDHSSDTVEIESPRDLMAKAIKSNEAEGLFMVQNNGVSRQTADIFYFESEGKIQHYFSCAKLKPVDRPQPFVAMCSLWTNIGPVGVKLSFAREFLPHWPTLLRKTEVFLDCMIVETRNKETP